MPNDEASKHVTDSLLLFARPQLADFQQQTWVEAAAPYIDHLYNVYQRKQNENHFSNNFSLTRFCKQLKVVLAAVESAKMVDSAIKEVDDEEKEWNATSQPTISEVSD